MTGLKDIAEQAGVSISSVSRTLSNDPNISIVMRKKVLKAIEELGYSHSSLRKTRKKNKQRYAITAIGLPSNNPFMWETLTGITARATTIGYTSLFSSDQRLANDAGFLRDYLRNQQVSGLIFISQNMSDDVEGFILETGIPCVTVGRYVPSRAIDSVTADNFEGGKIATRHLVDLGHTKIGLVAGPVFSTASMDRVRGYIEVMMSIDFYDKRLIQNGALELTTGYVGVKSLLEKDKDITAIFAASDIIAIGALDAISEMRLRTPEDIALVGFDNIDYSSLSFINLTTIDQPRRQLGEVACERLSNIIEREALMKLQHMVLPVELIVRKTSGPHQRLTEV